MKFFFITIAVLSTSVAIAQHSNPYEVFGHNSTIEYKERPVTELLLVKNSDTTSNIKAIAFDMEYSVAYLLASSDSVIGSVSIKKEDVLRWLSVDPLAHKREWVSPYNFVQNNPINRIDPTGAIDDVVITGTEKQAAFNELQSSVSSELTLTMNNNGKVDYSRVNANNTLSPDAQQLVDAINDKSVIVNVKAENTKQTTKGNLYIGGAFMGNTVIPLPGGNKVITDQQINPNVLSTADNYFGTSGSLTLHEVTESYQGALISKQSGNSASQATMSDMNNPNSVYMRSHNAATPQNMPVHMNIYDANGNVVPSNNPNAVRIEYSVQQGSRLPQIIMTYP